MDVTMQEPGSLYLRGFVGERYVGNGWTGLAPAVKAQSAMDFAWLHSQGFFGQNQYAYLSHLLNPTTRTDKVTVNNKRAGSGYVYAPYELITGNPDPNEIGDGDLPAPKLHGLRQYDYYVSNYPVSDYDQLYIKLAAAFDKGDKDVTTYLKSENVYRKYVYANYLDIPADASAAVETLLGGQKVPEKGIGFDAAQQYVRACLSSTLAFSETPPAYRGGDFMTYLLNSRQGYSVHFATAATLLFRALGVPARYVEGYSIRADAVQQGQPVAVTEADAHAWVEIYRDGVGFIPFESVPANTSDQNHTKQNQNNAGGAQEEQKPPKNPVNILQLLLWFLIGLLALAALAFLLLTLRRLWLLRRWKRLVAESAPNQAVELLTAYAVRLFGYMGIRYKNGSLYRMGEPIVEKLGQKTAESFLSVVSIQQQARFSTQPIEDSQRETVGNFAFVVALTLKKNSKLPARFRLRFIDCVI
jgi:hypothetical protein